MTPIGVELDQSGEDRRWRPGFGVAATILSLFIGITMARAGIYLPDGESSGPAALSDALHDSLLPSVPFGLVGSESGDIANFGTFTPGGDRIYLSDGFSVLDIRASDPSLDRHGRGVSGRVSLAISGIGPPPAGYAFDDGRSLAGPRQSGESNGNALSNMLSLYVNVIRTDAAHTRADGTQGRATIVDRPMARSEADRALVDVLLGGSADEAVANAIAFIVRPNVNSRGLVSFSIAGIGEFAIVAEQNDGAIGIVNLVTGSMFTVPGAGNAGWKIGMETYGWQPGEPAGEGKRRTGLGRATRIALAVVGYVVDVVSDPLMVGSVVFTFLLWTLWRSRRSHV